MQRYTYYPKLTKTKTNNIKTKQTENKLKTRTFFNTINKVLKTNSFKGLFLGVK